MVWAHSGVIGHVAKCYVIFTVATVTCYALTTELRPLLLHYSNLRICECSFRIL